MITGGARPPEDSISRNHRFICLISKWRLHELLAYCETQVNAARKVSVVPQTIKEHHFSNRLTSQAYINKCFAEANYARREHNLLTVSQL